MGEETARELQDARARAWFVDALPLNAVAKVDKRALAEAARAHVVLDTLDTE